ncbi:MAG: NAD-dependent epimerase/dehydratase family protein [Anaerolineae bacterium]|nr:NAD-dependent epimerase/dehydratase family protein [Anaerolineae bacterium]
MHTLVTGANGFVGSMLCKKLAARGDSVRGLTRTTSDLSLLEGVDVERVIGSLSDPDSLRIATREIDVVYHVAAAVTDWGPLDYFREINVEGTRRLLDAAVENGVSRFVLVSSVAVHSYTGARNMTEESPQLPTTNGYRLSKREAEALALDYHQRGDIEVAIVRPGDVYGPGDRVVLLQMADLLESGWMVMLGKGEALGAFAYVENLADGIVLAGTVPAAAGEAYVITDGIELSWGDYFDRLTAALDLPAPRLHIPPVLARIAAAVLESIYGLLRIKARPPITRYLVEHLSHDVHFSIEKARRELGYEPAIPFDEAIARTADWYKRVVRAEP